MADVPVDSSGKDSVKKGKKRSADKGGFRKAPGAPKRFKSPYILFSIARMDKLRKEMGSKTKVTSISKLVSDEWKALSEEERKIWEEHARQDKERYNAEKSLYTGPWQVPSKRSRKDPSAPKRPMSAFLFYSQGKRQELKEQNPMLKNTDISRLLGEMWKKASEDDRGPHIDREKMEREVYNVNIAEWRKQKSEEEQAVRKHRQEVAEQWIKSGFQTHGSGVAAQVYAPGIVAPGTVHGTFVQLPQQGQPQQQPPNQQQQHAQGSQLTMVSTANHGYAAVPQMGAPTLVPPGSDITYICAHQQQQQGPVAVGPVAGDSSSTHDSLKVPTPPVMIPEAPAPFSQPAAPPVPSYVTAPVPMYSKCHDCSLYLLSIVPTEY
jgi:hypothetical protein